MRWTQSIARFILVAGLGLSGAAQASILTSASEGKDVEGVKVSSEAKVAIYSRNYNLKLAGAGLRYKKVAFIKAKVYVGELFVDAPEKLKRDSNGALASLAEMKAVAIRMTFLRDVDGEKVSNGFKEALETNQVKLESPALKGFLDAVKAGGEAKDNKPLVILAEKLPGGKESVSYENAAGKVVTVQGDTGLMRDVFSIWLGKVDDSGLENLQKQILGL